MKAVAALAFAVAPAAAFLPVSAPVAPAQGSVMKMVSERSTAIPFDKRPENLDGSLVGDVGFDPAGFSNNPPRAWLIGGEGRSLKWYREAEIVHGRTAMLAALGWIVPEFVHFPGNEQVGVDAFAKTNPWDALYSVPDAGLWQIAATIFAVEVFRINRVVRGGAEPGDLGLGQGGLNPFGFNYTEEEYKTKQLQELKNGRLAMVAIIGMFLQSAITNEGLIAQLSGAFTFPDAVGKAGYYFPPGL
ncbi:light harvesting complex protein [Tribonema minus]|uniref:Light harvesting complex protein n=1 Tax=Tribonema minus TaxID=303371 RepID=A0A836CAI0_9STRA|nr:light harvesting complex protein [Tribonema minus]